MKNKEFNNNFPLQFKHVPLYLEWAPADVFCEPQLPVKEKEAAEVRLGFNSKVDLHELLC